MYSFIALVLRKIKFCFFNRLIFGEVVGMQEIWGKDKDFSYSSFSFPTYAPIINMLQQCAAFVMNDKPILMHYFNLNL